MTIILEMVKTRFIAEQVKVGIVERRCEKSTKLDDNITQMRSELLKYPPYS